MGGTDEGGSGVMALVALGKKSLSPRFTALGGTEGAGSYSGCYSHPHHPGMKMATRIFLSAFQVVVVTYALRPLVGACSPVCARSCLCVCVFVRASGRKSTVRDTESRGEL